MNVMEAIYAAHNAADDEVTITAMVASAFGQPEPDEFAWGRAFTRALAGDGPLTIRVPAAIARKSVEQSLEVDQMLRDYVVARRRGQPLEAVELRHTVHPERRLVRARARQLRASIGRPR